MGVGAGGVRADTLVVRWFACKLGHREKDGGPLKAASSAARRLGRMGLEVSSNLPVTDLGTPVGSGRRRVATQANKRIVGVRGRTARVKSLARRTGRALVLAKTGIIPAMTWGGPAFGTPPTTASRQRKAVASACAAPGGRACADGLVEEGADGMVEGGGLVRMAWCNLRIAHANAAAAAGRAGQNHSPTSTCLRADQFVDTHTPAEKNWRTTAPTSG